MGPVKLKEIKAVPYERAEVKKGYTDRSLHIDLTGNDIRIDAIDTAVKEKFIGGKG